jgi:hypothetical protein
MTSGFHCTTALARLGAEGASPSGTTEKMIRYSTKNRISLENRPIPFPLQRCHFYHTVLKADNACLFWVTRSTR